MSSSLTPSLDPGRVSVRALTKTQDGICDRPSCQAPPTSLACVLARETLACAIKANIIAQPITKAIAKALIEPQAQVRRAPSDMSNGSSLSISANSYIKQEAQNRRATSSQSSQLHRPPDSACWVCLHYCASSAVLALSRTARAATGC